MASVDKSSDAANIDDNAAADATSSCLNDPNFAIICVFLQKFGGHLKIEHPDFLRLQKMIENTDEVHDELRQFFVRLLRKTRKSVQPDKLDSALAKFCYTYSAQDAWEIERFGYKKSGLPVKLRVLKEVLESQFDKNPNFRTLVSAQTAAELRSQPLGKDKLGNAYWSTVDDQCNLRIYQEHLDEEIWKVVATNRDEMAKLIACLRGNELVMPSLVGIIDEDSSSNSMPPKIDALQNENGNGTTNNDSDEKNVPCLKIKLNTNGTDSTVEQIANSDNTNGAKNLSQNDMSIGEEEAEEEEEDASVMSEIDELSLEAASESSTTTAGTKSTETHGSKRISLMASKPPSNANKLKLRIFASDKKTLKRNLEDDSDTPLGKNKRPSMQGKGNGEDEESDFDSDELSDEELDDISGDEDDEVGPAIEEPTMYVQGEGTGADNNCVNGLWPDCDESDENEVGEAIEDDVLHVYGQGNGFDCDVGNNDIKSTETATSSTTTPKPVTQSKPMFFFGQAGCLKLSPMKPPVTTDNSSVTNKNDTETESAKSLETSSSHVSETDTNTNDTNSVALDAKSETIPESNADETDKGCSAVIEPAPTNLPENNIGDKIDNIPTSNDLSSTTPVAIFDESNAIANVEQSETLSSVAAIAESECSKENIESNSSVALANISVQEESESIEKESLPTTSETVLQTESHLTNENTIETSEINDSVEEQLSELDVAGDDLKSIEMENQPEHKLSEMNSEIDVNESNALTNDNENENQSSVSQTEEGEKEETSAEIKEKTAPVAYEDVPIANQTISSRNENEISETNESTSEQVHVIQDTATTIENDIMPLVEQNREEEEEEKEVTQDKENVKTNELDNESNNDIKTESISEQINAAETSTSTSEEVTRADTEEYEQEQESKMSQNIASIEISFEDSNKMSSEIPAETPSELPKQLEKLTEDSDQKPSEPVEPVKPIESAILPDEQIPPQSTPVQETSQLPNAASFSGSVTDELSEPDYTGQVPVTEEIIVPKKTWVCYPDEQREKHNETLPSTNDEIKQITTPPIESLPVAIAVTEPAPIEVTPIEDESSETIPSEVVTDESVPSLETEPITESNNEPILNEQNESTSNFSPIESLDSFENDNEETVGVEAELTTSVSVPIDSQSSETPEQVVEKPDPDAETVLTDKSEVIASDSTSVSITEKRKSIDQIEEVSECKKICEEKIPEKPAEPTKIEVNTIITEKVNELPTTSQDECVSKAFEIVEQSDTIEVAKISTELETAKKPSEIETSELSKEPELIDHGKKDASQISREANVEICHETLKNERTNLDEISALKTNDFVEKVVASVEKESSITDTKFTPENEVDKLKKIEPEMPQNEDSAAKVSIEAPVAIEKEKSPAPTRAQAIQAQSSRVAQLRTRKRRISSEKARHSSESDDNVDALIESPLSQDASSDEEVGGKRIKMRPKVVKRSVRKSVEQKRNIKDTDWSSDDNEKPNAKRATSELSKETENVLPSPEKVAPVAEKGKSGVKEESLSTENTVEASNAIEETKVKEEEEVPEHQSDEEQATPIRRPGRPARRGRKPGPKPKAKPSEEIKTEIVKDEPIEQNESIKEEKEESTPIKPETRRKKRSLMGLDIAEIETAQAAADGDTPVRQSRRIAQIKIREEAERRKAEEVALQKMKEASEKKKKGVVTKSQSASEVEDDDEEEEENSESEAKLEKKKKRKKENKERPWQTDSDDSSEREEEDVYEHEDVVERLPPLGSDHEFSPESDIEDESQIVPTKRARTARKDKTERREEESEEEEEDIHACQKCSKSDHPEWILLCDKCDKGYHCSCLIPVLFVIPEGDWFCPPCQQDKLIDHLEVKLIEFDNMIQQKEIEEAQRQRLLMTTISEQNVIKDTKRDRQRARAGGSDNSSDSSSTDEESEAEEKVGNSERRTRPRPRTNRQRNRSESESEASSSDNTSDNEPIYKLRKRRQANVSYRFNEYDELINRAIKSEMDEVAGAGNLGRGKDISTIIEADKEEKRLKKLEEQQKEREIAGETNEKDDDDSDDQPLKTKTEKSDGSDSEPIRPKAIKRSKNVGGRKKKKLNSLDVDSEEDADSSDDDFNTSSYSDDEEEEDSSPPSESSLDSIVKKRRGKGRGISTRRSARDRKKRYDADFIDDSSFDDEDNIPLVKKKKRVESDFDDFDESSEEQEEDVDSEDLCDDSTDESDRSWGKKKKKPSNKVVSNKSRKKKPEGERSFKGKTMKKKPKVSDDDDDDDDDNNSDDEYADEVLPKSRRTRGKKLPYLLDDDFDSSDDGIKPGVKRPDTPPEERAAFIKKQEEIKRMLAEKENDDKSLRVPPPQKDSLSTIPPQIIQSAKALDVDLKKSAILHRNASDNDSNGFDDDLPEDFDPEDMDEDAIAKMMEEEEFAQHQLKLAGETIRNRKLKDALTDPMKKDGDSPTKLSIETGSSVIMQSTIPSMVSPLPLSTSQLTIPDIPPSMYTAQFQTAGANSSKLSTTPKKRGRKTKDDILPLGPKEQLHPQLPTIQHTSIVPQQNKPNTPLNMPSVLQHAPTSQLFASSTIQHTSSVIAHSSVIQQQRLPPMPQTVAASILGMAQNRDPIIPSTVLDVQNTRLLDPSELGKPPEDLLDPAAKKRARSRKKITPTRDSLITSPPNVTVSPGITQPSPITIQNVSKPSSILSERLSANPVEKPGLSIASQPQLYSPSSRSQASVITRLTRPSQRQPFPSGQSPPQRYYAPNASIPSHSIPSTATGSHSRPYHTPNVTVASGPRPPPLVPPPHTSGHLPHPMYMRGQPGIYGGYPNIQPPPMHRSLQSIEHATNSPQNFTGAYQNLPFGSYYAAAQAAAAERRSGAIIGTFEPFDNKNPTSHDRLPAYAHPSLGLAALAGRNPTVDADDDRTGPPPPSVVGPGGVGGSTSEFSGLVSYFSSQQDDLDS